MRITNFLKGITLARGTVRTSFASRGDLNLEELFSKKMVIPLDLVEGIASLYNVDARQKKVFFNDVVHSIVFNVLQSSSTLISQRLIARNFLYVHYPAPPGDPREFLVVRSPIAQPTLHHVLATTGPAPFLHLFQQLAWFVGRFLGKKQSLDVILTDATFVAVPSKRFKRVKAIMKNQFKETPVIRSHVATGRNLAPLTFIVDTLSTNDNTTFKMLLDGIEGIPARHVIFDRGVSNISHLKDVVERGKHYITRRTASMKLTITKKRRVAPPSKQPASLKDWKVIGDFLVEVGARDNPGRHASRLVILEERGTGKRLELLTSNTTLPAWKVAMLYKERWSIEVFFKHLKGLFASFTRPITTSETGLIVQAACIMIAVLVLLSFAKVLLGESPGKREWKIIMELLKTWLHSIPGITVLDRVQFKWLALQVLRGNSRKKDPPGMTGHAR